MFKGGYEVKVADHLRKGEADRARALGRLNRDASAKSIYNSSGFLGSSSELTQAALDPLADLTGLCGMGDLFLATRVGNLLRVRQLVEVEGKKAGSERWSGITALHRAASLGHIEIVRYLVEKGKCDVNVRTMFGWHTPLHFAAKYGHEAVCDFLLDKGANWACANKDRETPMAWARKGGYSDMGRKLEQKVNILGAQHRKAKMQAMEAKYEEERKKKEAERLAAEAEDMEMEQLSDDYFSDEEDEPVSGLPTSIVEENEDGESVTSRHSMHSKVSVRIARQEDEDGASSASNESPELQSIRSQTQLLSPNNSFRNNPRQSTRKTQLDSVNVNLEDFGEGKGAAQFPINLPKITYVRKGKKCEFIYDALVGRSRVVGPRRYG